MATILDQRPTGDGYDVRILTGGEAYVLHFIAQPDVDTLAEAIRAFEARLIDEAVATSTLEVV
jgi:hypothetical protein